MALNSWTKTTRKQGSSKLTESRKTSSSGSKTSTTRSYKSGNYRTTVNLSTGKTKRTKLW